MISTFSSCSLKQPYNHVPTLLRVSTPGLQLTFFFKCMLYLHQTLIPTVVSIRLSMSNSLKIKGDYENSALEAWITWPGVGMGMWVVSSSSPDGEKYLSKKKRGNGNSELS